MRIQNIGAAQQLYVFSEKLMARFNQWTQLLKASATSRWHDEKSDGVKQERYLLLDTAMGSENSGDHVIMDACGCIADQIFGGALPHVATHYYSKELEMYPEYRLSRATRPPSTPVEAEG